MNNILVVDDEEILQDVLGLLLRKEGFRPLAAKSGEDALVLYEKEPVELVLLDLMLPGMSGLEVLKQIRQRDPDQVVIVITAYSSIEGAIEAMREGAFHYIPKPFKNEEVLLTIRKGLEQRRLQSENRVLKQELQRRYGLDNIIGKSQPMQQVYDLIRLAAPSKSNILILGESGTGKEGIARMVHAGSRRGKGPWVAVNCANFNEQLLESELFGHERGAFTGAVARREGRFELAGEGTLFLDEIADLEAALQSKLLRVLEDGGYQRVGASGEEKNRARIISATSRLTEKNSSGPLREDLYYRLAVIRIDVPPLRERRQDVPLLVQAFLKRLGSMRSVSEEAMQKLIAYHWPGNVRQLRHVLENACVMSTAEVLDSEALDLEAPRGAVEQPGPEAPEASMDLKENIDQLTRRLIEKALERSGGNRAQAARLLGIRRALLYERMLQLGMRDAE